MLLYYGGRDTELDKGASPRTLLNQTPNTINIYHGSQSLGDKLQGQEGNNPDRQLRSQNYA